MINNNMFASSLLEEREALSQKLNWEASQIEALHIQKDEELSKMEKFFTSYDVKEDILKRMSFFDVLRCQKLVALYKREVNQERARKLYSWIGSLNRRVNWNRESSLQDSILEILSRISALGKEQRLSYEEAYCLLKGWRSQLLRDANSSPLKEEKIALRTISNSLLKSKNVRALMFGRAISC